MAIRGEREQGEALTPAEIVEVLTLEGLLREFEVCERVQAAREGASQATRARFSPYPGTRVAPRSILTRSLGWLPVRGLTQINLT